MIPKIANNQYAKIRDAIILTVRPRERRGENSLERSSSLRISVRLGKCHQVESECTSLFLLQRNLISSDIILENLALLLVFACLF